MNQPAEERTPDVPDDLMDLAWQGWGKADDDSADEIRHVLAAVLPEHARQVRERTLREAADLLDSKPLHCEEHGSVTCTKCPVGSDWLRVEADRIARGEGQ